MQLAALHNAVDLPPTNHVINTHRYILEQLSQDCLVVYILEFICMQFFAGVCISYAL